MQLFTSCCGKGFEGKKKGETEPSRRIFSLTELHSATNSFNYDNKLGEGRFGSVYWGQLSDGSQVAVKRLKAWTNTEEIDFAVEIEILSRIRHKNLLSVRGYCDEGQERLLVYDYMLNLSLVSNLHCQQYYSGECSLDSSARIKIAIRSAQALAYLHYNATPRVVHGDVRASNVLLDSEFEPRVMDFGYGKLIPDDEEATKARSSSNGYLSPECVASGKETEAGDVYSFGILLLELVTGKRPVERLNATAKRGITEWVLPLVYKGKFSEIVDQKLKEEKNGEEKLKKLVLVGVMCAQREPEKRPTMSQVVEMLMNESKEKMSELEANLIFKNPCREVADESSDVISEEQQ